MKRKGVLIFVVLLAMSMLAGAYWYKDQEEKLIVAVEKGLTLGKAYGKIVSQKSCLDGLRMQYRKCNTTECELSANGFIVGCMNTAQSDEFCRQVPRSKETEKTLLWVQSTCSDYDLSNTKCDRYLHKLVRVCTEQIEQRRLSKTEIMNDAFNRGLKKANE